MSADPSPLVTPAYLREVAGALVSNNPWPNSEPLSITLERAATALDAALRERADLDEHNTIVHQQLVEQEMRVAQLEQVLRTVEWKGGGVEESCCPSCNGGPGPNHSHHFKSCALYAALRTDAQEEPTK